MTLTRRQLTDLIADSTHLPMAVRLGLPVALAFLTKEQVAELGNWIETTLARIERGEIEQVIQEWRDSGIIAQLAQTGLPTDDFIEGMKEDAEELARNR